MGYIPPGAPTFAGTTASAASSTHRHTVMPPLLVRRPTFADYRRDLYGVPGRDWMPFVGYGLLGSVFALVGVVAWMVS